MTLYDTFQTLNLKKKLQLLQKTADPIRVKDSLQHTYSFVTYDHLNRWVDNWMQDLDRDYDVIIGVPRSGLMVASLLATKLGKPLTTPDTFLQKKSYWASGQMYKPKKIKKVLLVEDCVFKGRELKKYAQKLRQMSKGTFDVTTASLILATDILHNNSGLVDTYYKAIPFPFLLEWNLVHSKKIFSNQKVCFDLDGVLCDDCTDEIDRDEDLYTTWLQTVSPKIIPTYKIHTIVTNRLEKYRPQTEAWLRKHKVRYDHLNMWNIASKDERKNLFSKRKIEVLKKIKPDLFVESGLDEAFDIYTQTKLPVLSIEMMVMLS